MRTFSAKRGGSNLKAKRKRLSIVFATLFAAKQGVCRAECTEATADDYATGAHVTNYSFCKFNFTVKKNGAVLFISFWIISFT